MAHYGYMRVSTEDQTHDLQHNALLKAGIPDDNIYVDTISGTKAARPGLQALEKVLKAGDILTVWKLDRLGRSLGHLIYFVERLNRAQVHFRSLTENLDTTTPAGKCMFHVVGAFAQMERELISQRTKEGLMAAKKRGQLLGRPSLTDDKLAEIRRYAGEPGATVRWVAKQADVSKSTVQRALFPKFKDEVGMKKHRASRAVKKLEPLPLMPPHPLSEFI